MEKKEDEHVQAEEEKQNKGYTKEKTGRILAESMRETQRAKPQKK